MKKIIFAFCLWFLAQNLIAQSAESDLQDLKVDVVYLASNLLEGRETGKTGEILAAQYIASRFEEIGLKPKGREGSWFQPFDFNYKSNPHVDDGEPRTGRNVVGFLDNGAATTVVIGAHYDHLGHGIFGSLYTGEPAIHNGADDNASGVAALVLIAKRLKNSRAKQNNYLFIAFSGEELGLYGSKYFVNNPTVDLSTVNYMLNMDMVGRLNEDKTLAVNGVGTSPVWKEELARMENSGLKIKTSESGIGPSDHTSFYLEDIPVLHFFTGQHSDYHKPSDDSELINYEGLLTISNFLINLVEQLDDDGKLVFTKTKDADKGKEAANFKVTLGIMPDYMSDIEGLRIDGVKEDHPAAKAGMKKGDIIVQMGALKVKDIYDYMEGLGKYKKGDRVLVKVKREEKVLELEVEF